MSRTCRQFYFYSTPPIQHHHHPYHHHLTRANPRQKQTKTSYLGLPTPWPTQAGEPDESAHSCHHPPGDHYQYDDEDDGDDDGEDSDVHILPALAHLIMMMGTMMRMMTMMAILTCYLPLPSSAFLLIFEHPVTSSSLKTFTRFNTKYNISTP